jgi:hypothetical protein
MMHWLKEHEAMAWWLGIGSAVMFFGSMLALPYLAARIPADYFTNDKRPPSPLAAKYPALRIPLAILRNLLGIIILLAGIAMLVLPGQGILSILLGIMLINFPGKYRLERWFIRKPKVNKAINWLRRKSNREPLQVPA